MTRVFGRAFALWLPFLVAITGVFLYATLGVQQTYRQGLDDPQIQMAEDAAARLARGESPQSVVPGGTQIEMSVSLAPWLAVYSASGTPLAASGLLDGQLPQLPPGVFDMSTWNWPIIGHHLNRSPVGENRISWQPRFDNAPGGGVRQALILVHYTAPDSTQGYVAAGRNSRTVENREEINHAVSAVLWAATALGTLIALIIVLALGWL